MKQFLILWGLFGLFVQMQAQQDQPPILERDITVSVSNQTIESVLLTISGQAGFVFSYSPDMVNTSTKVSLNARHKPVRIVLNQLFNDEVTYKVKGKYVILRKSILAQQNSETKTVEGYIYDQKGEKLTEASVYDKDLLVSAVTDKYGYFRMKIPSDKPLTGLHVSKEGFLDTLIIPTSKRLPKTLEIALTSQDTTRKNELTTIFQKFIPQWLIPKEIKIHSINLRDSIFKNVQFSFIPMVSTNLFLTGNVKNDYSINLTIGYVNSIGKAEFGGMINIVRSNAGVFQVAGIGNIVGGVSTGFQGAGIFNLAQSSQGVQSAGIFNISSKNSNVQLAGVFNQEARRSNVQIAGIWNNSTQANVQIAGVLNNAAEADIQIAGISNVAVRANVRAGEGLNANPKANMQIGEVNQAKDFGPTELSGQGARQPHVQMAGVSNIATQANVQVAGILNRAQKTNAQVAGVINLSNKVKGFQLSGILNFAAEPESQIAGCINTASNKANVQVAGLVNIGGTVQTLQVGFVNIADSCAGVPLGFFSFVKKGYHSLEISYDELSFTDLAFRTGTKYFHNIFSAGISADQFSKGVWRYGYGVGTSLGNVRKLLVDFDVSSYSLFSKNSPFKNSLYQVYLGINPKIFKKLSIAVGVSYNLLVSDTKNDDYEGIFSKLAPYHFTEHTTSNGTNFKTWMGGKIALRFW